MKITHRPQSVQPDLDDVLLKPNMAREADNLRFSAGEDDTNLGITAVRGNRRIPTGRPVLDQHAIGFLKSEERGVVFQAVYSATGAHSIQQIDTENNIKFVAFGSWLNFRSDSFVSMAYVAGSLYFTDEVNPPRKLIVDKAINTWNGGTGDRYPQSNNPPEWIIARVKRQPGFAASAEAITGNIVKDFNTTAQPKGYQLAFYYIYDGFENSRLSPYSDLVFTTSGLVVQLPEQEFPYIDTPGIIREVVIAYRLGNNGTWYELKRLKPLQKRYEISDMRRAPRTPIPGELLTDTFDDVPLLSGWNTIIENRLLDADFVQGYNTVDTLTLRTNFVPGIIGDPIRTFKPGGETYNVGIELLDEYGKRIGVVNDTTVITPIVNRWYQVVPVQNTAVSPTTYFGENNSTFNKDLNNIINLEATIEGTFPSWAKYARIVYSRNQSTSTFFRTQAKMLYWYKANGEDFFVLNAVTAGGSSTGTSFTFTIGETIYTYEGIVILLAQDEPFAFDASRVNFVDVIGAIHSTYMSDAGSGFKIINYDEQKFLTAAAKKYRIEKVEENRLFIKFSQQDKENWFTTNYLGNPNNINTNFKFWTTSLDITLEVQKDAEDPFYYQTSAIQPIAPGATRLDFRLYGDCYLTNFKKTYRGVRTLESRTLFIDTAGNTARTFPNWGAGLFDIFGTYVAMNPTDIYNENWDSDIGQPTIVNPNQEQKTFKNTPLISNPIFPGTKVNGLSQVSSLDQPDQYSLEAGAITGVISTTGVGTEPGVVLFICENDWFSTYINASEIQLGAGSGALTIADKFFGSRRLLQGRYGTRLRHTIQGTDRKFVYAYSDKVKDLIRYSGEGLQALGVTHGFGNLLDREVGAGNNVAVGYDSYYDEVHLVNRSTKTAYVFSERYKAFQGKRQLGLAPNFLVSLNEVLYSTANGEYYVSDRRANMGEFYGLATNQRLVIVANAEYAFTKLWQHIEIYGQMPEQITLTTPNGQRTTLLPDEMVDIKDRFYGAFRGDETSDGGKYNGSLIESNLCFIEIIWNFATFEKLNQIVVGAVPAIAQ